MRTSTIATVALLAISSATFVTGCDTSITGEQGNLEFRYTTDDGIANFNKPIAVGAKLDLRVYKAGTGDNRDATISSAVSEDSEVLNVSGTSGNTLTLQGAKEGSAKITVKATLAAGGSVEDSVTMRAAVPEVLKLSHMCAPGTADTMLYMVSQKIFLPFDMELADGQSVVGYGYYPVKAEPEGAFTVKTDVRDQAFMHLELGATAGDVTIASLVDDTKLKIKLVTEAEIDGMKLDEDKAVGIDKTTLLTVTPQVGTASVCQAQVNYTVTSATPEICEAKKISDADVDAELQELVRKYGWIEVKGLKAGDCKIQVKYPNAAAGAGVEKELAVSVENI